MRYYQHMPATITQFRKDLFHMADKALNGENVEFTYKGVLFKVTPQEKQSKLENLVGEPVLAPGVDMEAASRELAAEMESEWLNDWTDL
jgi:hypothetical protein